MAEEQSTQHAGVDAASRGSDAAASRASRARWRAEIWIVLGLSLGQSAVYSVLSILDKLTRPEPLNQQTTSMNNSVAAERPWLDLSYQLAGIVFPLVPVALVLYLLALSGQRREIGFDLRRPRFDVGWGWVLTAAIGIPGLALYFAARELGVNTNVAPANLAANWWTVPVLVGLSVMNGVLEEVVMLGFLFTRLRQLGWSPWAFVLVSALIRATYHVYQGFGGFVGNLVMGLAFGWLYLRWKRVGPLVVAHTNLDLFAFIGYAALAPYTDLF